MLTVLRIENIALIDALEVEFSRGLNILTGETGAGKSVIIGSIGIALGGKFDRALLRNEEKDGLVEVSFTLTDEELERIREQGCLPEDILDTELVITRKLLKNRVVNRINGETVPIGTLKETAELLINLHAQHEQTTLLKPAKHLELLDAWDGAVREQRDKVQELFRKKEELKQELLHLDQDPAERAKKTDFLKFQLSEIKAAKLKEGEDEELEEEYRRMCHAEEMRDICRDVYQLTSDVGAGGAASCIGQGMRRLNELTRLDPESPLPGQLSEVEGLLSDFNQSLSAYLSEMSFSPDEMKRTEDRLNLINGLKAKYGRTIGDILENGEKIEKELEEQEKAGERLAALGDEINKAEKELSKAAAKLTVLRKAAAGPLEEEVRKNLEEMNFSHVEFYTSFDELSEITANGKDDVCFMLSTNLGEEARPLHKIASGGELSRVMLALKAALSGVADTPTLVFDEIDVGISGITAQKTGMLLKKLAETRQLIVITHLPQIAAAADTAFKIEKTEDRGKTYTGIRQLSEEGRVIEIARLLGGKSISESIIAGARELINGSRGE